MSFFKPSVLLGALAASASLVDAHGYVTGIVANGQYYGGYLATAYPYEEKYTAPRKLVAWSEYALDTGFIGPADYKSPNIVCHLNAKPAALSAEVPAGSTVEMQWTEWPESHHGPVLNYLANCNGDCSSVDKTQLEFFKINEGGLINGRNPTNMWAPGTWASDQLIANNNSWTVTIPENIAPGNYVLRHEIIALHSAQNADGAQNYPQCFNLKITGSGTEKPAGTLASNLYTPTDPGIKISIYQPLDHYDIPGPALISGGTTGDDVDGSAVTHSASGGASSSSSSSASSPSATATPPKVGTSTATVAPYPTTSSGGAPGPIGTGTGMGPAPYSSIPTSLTPAPTDAETPSVTPVESPTGVPTAVPIDVNTLPANPGSTAGAGSSSPSSPEPVPTGRVCNAGAIPEGPLHIPDTLTEVELIEAMNAITKRLYCMKHKAQ